MTATAPAAPAPAPAGLDAAIPQLVGVLQQLGRTDLADRANAAGARLRRPATVVCVVGEFKQGKSSLVNGLLGRDACPVDDDVATAAITLVRYGDQPAAMVRRRVDGQQLAEQITIEDLPRWVTEAGNPGNREGVERVEIAVPSAILKQGLVLVDTPGMGGLGAGHAAATLAFLPFADGVILVSDASAELSAPEVEFLARAAELCPTVLFVQSKIDLYPSWPRILDINRGHLERSGVRVPVAVASSALRHEALVRKDRDLNERSQFPGLIKALDEGVVTPAKEHAAERSAADVRAIVSIVRTGLEEEQRLLDDPNALTEVMAELEQAKSRLEFLRGPGAKWSIVVSDRVADLSNDITFQFRAAMRSISDSMDEQIENLRNGTEWDEMVRQMQSEVAEGVTRAFVAIEHGFAAIEAEVVDMLQEEQLGLPPRTGRDHSIDVSSLWTAKPLDEKEVKGKRAFQTGVTGIRGVQSGMYMFSSIGSWLPSAAGALLIANPVMIGAGALFGSMQLLDDRKRKLTARRQSARQQVRKFLDDVQFQVGNEIATMVREGQRELRDEFTDRLGELQRTYAETAQRAQADVQRSQQERQARAAEGAKALAALAAIEKQVGG
ncbi:MAG TPA: dynamin family protein [Acidimicrobiia bacterium]|nr:dynamin family protein [Acidimicrobiia bacterium]